MLITRRANRVCPRAAVWQLLDALLDKAPVGLALEPPKSLSTLEWHTTTIFEKRQRLRQQIEWAAEQGYLEPVREFLEDLPEEHWHHI